VALSRLLWPVAAAAWYPKVVKVDPVTTDRCRRTVAFVKVGDTVVNDELIRQRLARVFSRYCDRPMCEQWERLEDEARAARRELWSLPNALPPWEFRRSGKSRQALGLASPNLPMTWQ
jgi:endonuclease YncB( thermonuclease family)